MDSEWWDRDVDGVYKRVKTMLKVIMFISISSRVLTATFISLEAAYETSNIGLPLGILILAMIEAAEKKSMFAKKIALYIAFEFLNFLYKYLS